MFVECFLGFKLGQHLFKLSKYSRNMILFPYVSSLLTAHNIDIFWSVLLSEVCTFLRLKEHFTP